MTYKVDSIEELEKLINDRIYIDNLTISMKNIDIEPYSKFLTDLTCLDFKCTNNKSTDFKNLTNLKFLCFNLHYCQKVDISMLKNLTTIIFPTHYNCVVDFSECTKIKEICYGYRQIRNVIHIPNGEKVKKFDFSNFDYYKKLYSYEIVKMLF